MDFTNVVRCVDIFVLGPINVLFAFTVENKLLAWATLITGFLTIFYNSANLCRFLYKFTPKLFEVIPKWCRTLFWDNQHGKTQFLRLINLLVMYPLLVYAYTKSKPKGKLLMFTKQSMGLFIVLGFLYNLWYFISLKT